MTETIASPVHEAFSPETARAILLTGDPSGNFYYDTLVGAADFPTPWDSPTATDVGYDVTTARHGLGTFMTTVVNELAGQLGVAPWVTPEKAASLQWSRHFVFEELNNGKIAPPKTSPSPQDNYPWLRYQSPRHFGDQPANEPQLASRPSFLHFGSLKDIKEVQHSPLLAAPVRLYLNPDVNHTAEVTTELCKGFIAARGFLPKGKFMEDASAVSVEDRSDRLLFWLGHPEDITAMIGLIAELQKRRPEIFAGRPGILLGESVAVGDNELPTVRIAQEPLGGKSFNDSHLAPLQRAVREVFGSDGQPREATDEQVSRFIDAAKLQVARDGWHSERPAFLAGQDMSVIDAAIAAAV